MLIDCMENGLMQTHQASGTRRAPSAVSSGDSFDSADAGMQDRRRQAPQ